METRILQPEEWPQIAGIMRDEFHNSMPATPEQSSFLAAMDGGLAGFVHVETLYHVNCVYVAPKYRRTRLAWQLMKEVETLIHPGFSAIVLTDKAHVARMMPRLGMRKLGDLRVFRKDF